MPIAVFNNFKDRKDNFHPRDDDNLYNPLTSEDVLYTFSDINIILTENEYNTFKKEKNMSNFMAIPFHRIIFCAHVELPHYDEDLTEQSMVSLGDCNIINDFSNLFDCDDKQCYNYNKNNTNYYVWKTNVTYTCSYFCSHSIVYDPEYGCHCRGRRESTFTFPALYISNKKNNKPLQNTYEFDYDHDEYTIIVDKWELVKKSDIHEESEDDENENDNDNDNDNGADDDADDDDNEDDNDNNNDNGADDDADHHKDDDEVEEDKEDNK